MRRETHGLLAGMLVALAACSGPAPPGPSKIEARAAKADGLTDGLCDSLDLEPGCDICEAADWYGDGVCDDFCPTFDADDCAISTCEDLSAAADACAADGGTPAECAGQPGTTVLAQECCDEDSFDFCVALGLRPSGEDCQLIDLVIDQCVTGESEPVACIQDLAPPDARMASLCCVDAPEQVAQCDLLAQIDECELVDDEWTECVFDAIGDGLSRGEAEAGCADILAARVADLDCCAAVPVEICEHLDS